MIRTRTRSRLLNLATATAVVALLAGCAATDADDDTAQSEPSASEPSPTTARPDAPSEDAGEGDADMGDEAGMGAMLGSADATPADEVGGELVQGDVTVLDAAPDGTTIAGTGLLARTANGTVVTLRLTGLEPGTRYVSHVHTEACSGGGGPHYAHEADGDAVAPNEIHLAFVADDRGEVEWTVENPEVAGEDAVSLVVHADVDGAPKLACADLA